MTDSGFPYFTSIFNYGNLVESWYAFVNLLDVNFEEGFVCDKCGPDPRTIVCDGTSLGFRRSLLMTAMSKIPELQVPIPRRRLLFSNFGQPNVSGKC
jgi:hypothetical protein